MAPRVYLPMNQAQWQIDAQTANVSTMHIKTFNNMQSGSKITMQQYLLFRVLYQSAQGRNFEPKAFGIQIARAKSILESKVECLEYLKSIGTNSWTNSRLGVFSIALLQQWEVLNPAQQRIGLVDEAAVNSSLISFLNGVVAMELNPKCWWSSHRGRMDAVFAPATANQPVRSYTAYTDGQLRSPDTNDIKVWAECKRKNRSSGDTKTSMQEVAQAVASIKASTQPITGPKCRRWIVSQDRDELYLSCFECDQAWIQYIQGGNPANSTFATMKRFGPWMISDASDMKEVAQIVLALSLRPDTATLC